MINNILGIFTNIGVIFSFLFNLGNDKFHHERTLLPKIGLAISILSLMYHVIELFHHMDVEKREDHLLEKLF